MMSNEIFTKLSLLPRLSDVFVWCDYIELRCLVHPDKSFSRSDLMETQEEMTDTRDDADDISDEEYAEDLGLDFDEFQHDEMYQSTPAVNDRLQQKTYERFLHLKSRLRHFGDDLYPFYFDEELQSIYLKDELNDWHYFYIQLLISSALRYCPRSRRHELTGPFEEVSYAIFKCLMPQGWIVHPFGKDKSSRYRGHLYDKLSLLADDVRGELAAKRTHFSERDQGDGGLDLVAWHPMSDERNLIPMAFAQCGCTAEEFGMKMLEASPSKLGLHLKVGYEWACYYFMPQSMLTNDGKDWLKYSDFSRSIVVDRFRIMKIAKQYQVNIHEVIKRETIQEALEISFY